MLQLPGRALDYEVPICFLLGQGVPDGDQEIASDGDNGLVPAEAWFQPSQPGLPMGVEATGNVGRLYHRGTDIAPKSFGDSSALPTLLTAVVHPPCQASVAESTRRLAVGKRRMCHRSQPAG
jgi:hypothetical protein